MKRSFIFVLFLLALALPVVSTAGPLDTWHSRNQSSQGKVLNGVIFAKDMFVAVGDKSILTSSDGAQWTERYTGGSATLSGVAYGNNTFVAVGSSVVTASSPYYPTETILTSADGLTWTELDSKKFGGGIGQIMGITYGGNAFVAVGKIGFNGVLTPQGDSKILTSSDGMTWTYKTQDNSNLKSVAYGENIFTAVGDDGVILTSYDGSDWKARHSHTKHSLGGVTYGNNIFVAVGEKGTVLTSKDGIKWTKRKSRVSDLLYGVTYGNDSFVAAGAATGSYSSSGVILTSTDGTEWTGRNIESSGLYAVTSGGKTFMAVGDGSGIMQSDIIYPVLTVSTSGKGTGIVESSDGKIVCGNDCEETYSSNETVTLTATPVSGYILGSWSGGGCSGSATCVVTMDSNKDIIASFKVPEKYKLKVNVVNSGHGVVTSSDNGINCGSGNSDCVQKPYYEGSNTEVILTATPDSGYTFKGWSGSGCSSNGTCTVTMDGNKTVTATFKKLK